MFKAATPGFFKKFSKVLLGLATALVTSRLIIADSWPTVAKVCDLLAAGFTFGSGVCLLPVDWGTTDPATVAKIEKPVDIIINDTNQGYVLSDNERPTTPDNIAG